MRYMLFVCNHNAGRSQMAQAFFERHAPEDVRTAHRLRLQHLLPKLADEFDACDALAGV